MSFEEIIEAIPQKPYYQDLEYGQAIYCADCRSILPFIPDKSIDLVLTDPPYESQHLEYGNSDISFLMRFDCRQLVFWSARDNFPISYTAKHIWDKQIGGGSQYEMIYERNGQSIYRVFSAYRMNNPLNASWVDDNFTGHPSQKPQRLIGYLISQFASQNNIILDPFLGSGTTAYCAKKLGRKCIGIEIEEKYCEIAAKRLSQSVMKI